MNHHLLFKKVVSATSKSSQKPDSKATTASTSETKPVTADAPRNSQPPQAEERMQQVMRFNHSI